MSSGSNWRKPVGQVGDRVNKPADAHDNSNGDEHTVRYGDEAVWTSVVWAVIGIVTACGLAALLLLR